MKKGSVAGAWLVAMIGIFVVIILYIIFTPAVEGVYNVAHNLSTNSSAISTMNLIMEVWTFWPIIMIIGFILYGFVSSQRRDPAEYY